tara:strand:+ start:146 stop:1216 length:1071 start_codon:yes stop_codon:yes gene_type:complete
MDNSWIRNCVAGSPTFCEDFGPYDRLIPFMKEQEGSIKYQTNISKTFDPTTNEFIAYKDKVSGKLTIGYGHTQNVKPGDRISIQEANQLLRTDIKTNATKVNTLLKERYGKTLPEFNEAGKFLLIDMAFNIGPEGLTNKETGWKKMINGLVNNDWVTVSQEYTAINTPERNKARFKKFIEPHLIATQQFQQQNQNNFKQFEEQDKKESLEKQKIVYNTMPDLVNAIQTKEIPKEKIKGFITDVASSKLLSEIGERIHVPEFIENLGIDVDVKGKDEFAIKGKGLTYKQDQDTKSISGKGLTYTDTPYDQSLVKEFGKEGDITGSVGISKSDFGDEKTIGGQINIPTDKIFRRRKRR